MQPQQLGSVLRSCRLWGLELDPKFRVLAVTLELGQGQTDPWQLGDDRRVQVLCYPVSTILGSLRHHTDQGGAQLATFEADQLVDVAAAFGGAVLEEPLFGRPEPRPGQWGPQFSLQGRSTAPDGRSNTITISVSDDDARLELFARFDDLEVRDPSGRQVPSV